LQDAPSPAANFCEEFAKEPPFAACWAAMATFNYFQI